MQFYRSELYSIVITADAFSSGTVLWPKLKCKTGIILIQKQQYFFFTSDVNSTGTVRRSRLNASQALF